MNVEANEPHPEGVRQRGRQGGNQPELGRTRRRRRGRAKRNDE
jgi:hypothetical protein